MTELALPEAAPSTELVVPGTGELVNLADPAAVAVALHGLRLHKEAVESARATLEAALVAESGRVGIKTLHLPGAVAKIGPDSDLEWDVTILVELIPAGLPRERYDELVTLPPVTPKVNAAVAKQIEGSNDVYAEIIRRARSRVPKRASVKVDLKRQPGTIR